MGVHKRGAKLMPAYSSFSIILSIEINGADNSENVEETKEVDFTAVS
jgi:hypothetical protein